MKHKLFLRAVLLGALLLGALLLGILLRIGANHLYADEAARVSIASYPVEIQKLFQPLGATVMHEMREAKERTAVKATAKIGE